MPNTPNDSTEVSKETVTQNEWYLAEALWQAYYHSELDELAVAITNKGTSQAIDGNDHKVFYTTAKKLYSRFLDAKI